MNKSPAKILARVNPSNDAEVYPRARFIPINFNDFDEEKPELKTIHRKHQPRPQPYNLGPNNQIDYGLISQLPVVFMDYGTLDAPGYFVDYGSIADPLPAQNPSAPQLEPIIIFV